MCNENGQVIGENSGKVWDALKHTVTGISIQELCHQLALSFEDVMTAIRCLSHDYNIGLANRDGQLILIGE